MSLSINHAMPVLTIRLVQWSMGLCYLWFGLLKFFPHLSPAESLASDTIEGLTFGLLSGQTALMLLAVWEVGLGLLLILGKAVRWALRILLVHMLFTLSPAFLMPEEFFTHVPYGLTLVGQYIVKNFVFMATAVLLLQASRPPTKDM